MSGVEDGEVVDPMSQCIMGNCHMEKPPPPPITLRAVITADAECECFIKCDWSLEGDT